MRSTVAKGFDVDRFVRERTGEWQELEGMLAAVDAEGMPSLGIEGARRLGQLYRAVSSDLVRTRTEVVDLALVDYLNDLVARTYARVYAGSPGLSRRIAEFFL
jgi:hypothetical protein